MTKYQETFHKMLDQNKQAFDEFRIIHDKYSLNPDNLQEEYNKAGNKIMYIVRRYEDMLCGRSEGTGYGKYTEGLAAKFHAEIKKSFPNIDRIGIIPFTVKKISLKS